ncbi:hypothetical protein LJC59_05110 [Desulfovibrio sp. OttesenSCG-928-A18]|nr:hypothetical protein [Desulfovibrio sp. OttesenSCG-928-A18]
MTQLDKFTIGNGSHTPLSSKGCRCMGTGELLTAIGALAALVGVFFLILAYTEYRKLSRLRDDFATVKRELKEDMERVQRAIQLVIASYAITEVKDKIALLEKAVGICPDVFNGFNALGYAHIEANNPLRALHAFTKAIEYRPKDKAGYFDCAHAYILLHDTQMAIKNLQAAIAVDGSAKDDLKDNVLFASIQDSSEYKALLR